MNALEKLLLVAVAGGSAGSAAGKSAGSPKARQIVRAGPAGGGSAPARPDAHVLHMEHEAHLRHLHHLHVLHQEHMAHLEGEHHDGASATPRKAAPVKSHAVKAKVASGAKAGVKKEVGHAAAPIKTPKPVGLAAILQLAADEEDAGSHLHRECPWFRSVAAGDAAADFHEYCKPAKGSSKVRLTPETPEASTVVKPTVPPGGPGLFHMKGRHLPPYVEHLYTHLVARYGKEKAYGVAVGIVKKWAAGVNPGGKHPTKTHADVRAAAGKNVAEWEKDKADAHKQSASHGH